MAIFRSMTMKFRVLTNAIFLLILGLPTHAQERVSYICESTHQDNGETKEFKVSRQIEFQQSGAFKEMNSKSPFEQSSYRNGKWFHHENGRTLYLDIHKLRREISSTTSLWLKFSPDAQKEALNISPVLLPYKKGDHLRNKMMVLFHEPTLPIFESIGLPFNAHYVKSSDLYIEYSYKNKMINRIEQSAKSSYIKKSHVCIKKKISLNLQFTKARDITLRPELWPSSLKELKKSLALLYLENEDKSRFAKKIINSVSANFLIQRSSKTIAPEFFTGQGTKNSNFNLFYSPAYYKGKTLYSVNLDKTKKASKRYSYIPNKTLNLHALSKVSLNRKGQNHYFYFHNQDKSFNIEVGPIELEKLFWRKDTLSNKKCLRNLQKHFSEYERKSFIFKNKGMTPFRSIEEIQRARKYRHYPVDSFILTNNCRSLGSFEYEIPGIVKGYFQLPPNLLIKEAKSLFEYDWNQIFTESRVTDFYLKDYLRHKIPNQTLKDKVVSLWSKNYEKNYTWLKLSDFDSVAKQCSISEILTDLKINKRLYRKASIQFDQGFINFNRFLHETRKKSADIGESNPFSYVKTPCSKNTSKPPYSFRPPKHLVGIKGKDYWQRGTCEWIPHQFYKYSELKQYKVGLSAFEVDGIYTGHNYSKTNDKKDYKPELAKDDKVRREYNYRNVYSFDQIRYRKSNGKLNLILSNKEENFNLLISNILLSELEETGKRKLNKSETRPWYIDNFKGLYNLIGLTPYPLASEYDSIIQNDTISFFYSKDKVLDHHTQGIGIEQWYLTKKDNIYTLDLISHERILPVAKISFEIE
jgi:hypothetical protein